MSILEDFKPCRKVTAADAAQAIRDTITMDEALAMYYPSIPRRNGRCPCPIHNGKDYNFAYSRFGYKCFVCGASGDVIGFVKEACELATRSDAMKRINQDFNLRLPIGSNITAEVSAELARKRSEAARKEREREEWEQKYAAAMNKWIDLDRMKRTEDPNSDSYAYAVKNIDRVSYEIDALLDREPR